MCDQTLCVHALVFIHSLFQVHVAFVLFFGVRILGCRTDVHIACFGLRCGRMRISLWRVAIIVVFVLAVVGAQFVCSIHCVFVWLKWACAHRKRFVDFSG